MTDLSHIPVEELLFDRQECFNEVAVLAIAKIDARGITTPKEDERLAGNLKMIEIIREECGRRGFDPAIHNQVRSALT